MHATLSRCHYCRRRACRAAGGTAACPVSAENEQFLGPAALLRAFRYLFDSRDEDVRERMRMLDTDDAIWGCKSHGRCTEVCPKEIDVRKCLAMTKKKIHDAKQK